MTDLNKNIQKLTRLVEQSQNKKLLWEEMQIISSKAFDLQDKIMAELDKTEAIEKDIVKVQAAFNARESIWELMHQITDRELELKTKAHHKETPDERAKRHKEIMADVHEHHCGCGHHHEECCCHHHEENCCHEKPKKGKCKCKKK
ncbi:MAG: hypothetical protein IKS41_00455 [Alphaproteobacteria bacterium]|nr:hypothetical protein [Alphaproteobacteria bacterium]